VTSTQPFGRSSGSESPIWGTERHNIVPPVPGLDHSVQWITFEWSEDRGGDDPRPTQTVTDPPTGERSR